MPRRAASWLGAPPIDTLDVAPFWGESVSAPAKTSKNSSTRS